jgi:1,2-phenylacetyl-CoA epoxidase PaaB subunit
MKGKEMNHYEITFEIVGLPYQQTFSVVAPTPETAIERFRQDSQTAIVVDVKTVKPDALRAWAKIDD